MKLIESEKRSRRLMIDLGADVIGSIIFAVGLVCFTETVNIAPGGVTGIAIIVNYVWSFPLGVFSIILNIPLLILAWLYLGQRFTWNTVRSLFINSIIIDLLAAMHVPLYTGDRLLGALFGGVLMGAGQALIFIRGSTTGGTDIVSYLVARRLPHISIGRGILFVDCVVIAASMLVFRDIDSGMYGIISLFCSSRVIDGLIYGMDKGSLVTVVSTESQEIADTILSELGRGVTFLEGQGGYSGQAVKVILCAVRKTEYAKVKRIVYEIDDDAFVVVNEAGEILGEGFKLMK